MLLSHLFDSISFRISEKEIIISMQTLDRYMSVMQKCYSSLKVYPHGRGVYHQHQVSKYSVRY